MENNDKLHHPLVSIVMATFNEPVDFITEAIESILHQTYNNWELLICDDSTNADTIDAINQLANTDSRIKIIRKSERMGFVNALNEGLSNAKGELIARMDGDDIAIDTRLEKQVAFAVTHPNISLFGGNIYIINERGEVLTERHYETSPHKIQRMFMYRNPFAHPTIMFRRNIIDRGFFYDTQFKKAEDVEFYLRLYKNGYQFRNLNDFLLKYRVVGDMQKKRQLDNWYFNHKARSKNFIRSKPLFSICSWFISLVYKYTPKKVISYLYKRENQAKR
jgi:glycosyltransferase EpsE